MLANMTFNLPESFLPKGESRVATPAPTGTVTTAPPKTMLAAFDKNCLRSGFSTLSSGGGSGSFIVF